MRLKILTVSVALAACVVATGAEARPTHETGEYTQSRSHASSAHRTSARRAVHRTSSRTASVRRGRVARAPSRGSYIREASSDESFSGRRSSVGPRPGAWCGWWMRTQRGGGPEYNLAWNWRNYGSPSGPQVGAVVVWRHHVGEIVGQASNGQWIVRSGNDGHAVRTRARSVAGAIFRI